MVGHTERFRARLVPRPARARVGVHWLGDNVAELQPGPVVVSAQRLVQQASTGNAIALERRVYKCNCREMALFDFFQILSM